jgi:hypothetical protein
MLPSARRAWGHSLRRRPGRAWGGWHRIVAVTALAEQAIDLAERHGLRGYEALHLAAAFALAARRWWADGGQTRPRGNTPV